MASKSKIKTEAKDWKIGITIDVLFLFYFAISSFLEIFSDQIEFSFIGLLIAVSVFYYAIKVYKLQHEELKGIDARATFRFGVVILLTMSFFSAANLFLISSGEIGLDLSLLNIILILALAKSVFNLKSRLKKSE